TPEGAVFALTPGRMGDGASAVLVQIQSKRELIPQRRPLPGEQYRFHFDMTKCIGCKCCVVACNEQNGNPGDLHWRRVGEIEGGRYPETRRWYLSMGCNHCLEPACLIGCPVEAYVKDSLTGVVKHDADICIGCQYCTWNCSYGVPQYNAERGVVGKCDLCHNRLQDGDTPACADACPQGAIAIEIVNIAQWRTDHGAADAPGLPSSADSLSTTRVTLPADMPVDIDRVDRRQFRLEQPHWALVFMLTLTQMSVGAIACVWRLSAFSAHTNSFSAVVLALMLAAVSLLASALHLGRPIYAYRAIRAWRRSWLSREVLTLGAFAALAGVYGCLLMLNSLAAAVAGGAAIATGLAGIYCSARIYMVPARPAWNSGYTVSEFFLTACLLGPLLIRTAEWRHSYALGMVAAAAGCAGFFNQIAKLLWLARAEEGSENRVSATLLLHRLRGAFFCRLGLLLAGGIALPLASPDTRIAWLALLLALAGETIGRWLFFAGVTPKSVAATFVPAGRAA